MSKIKTILLIVSVALTLSINIKAQDTLSAYHFLEAKNTSPLITIKGEEFRRFPSSNFLDAVNGFFPWVFALKPNANDFIFVVNGFLLTDVNSISLNDIEAVSFCGTSLQGSLYPLSKAGTFYITTRRFTGNKPIISFNSQYNFISSGKRQVTNTTQNGRIEEKETNYNTRYALVNHASLLTGGKKWELYAAAQLDNNALPDGNSRTFSGFQRIYLTDTLLSITKQKNNNFRSFARFNYKPLSNLSIGISGTYFNGTSISNSTSNSYTTDYKQRSTGKSKTTLPYYNGAAFAEWNPLRNLRSHTSFEYTNEHLDDLNERTGNLISYSSGPTSGSFTASDVTGFKSSRSLLRNKTEYSFASSGKIQIGVSNVFSYFNQTIKYQKLSVSQPANGGLPSSSGSEMFSKEKLTSLNPGFHITYNNLFSFNAGFAFLINNGVSKYTAASRSNPYASLMFNVKNLLKLNQHISRFDISVNYDNLNKNNWQNNWLPVNADLSAFSQSINFGAPVFSPNTVFYPNPALEKILLKNKILSVEANAAFLGNKLLAGLAWRELQSESIFINELMVSTGITISAPFKGKEVKHSIAIYAAAAIIDQAQKKWNIRVNILAVPRYSYKFDDKLLPDILLANQQLQIGLQNNFTYKNWFGQLNGLVAVNKKAINTFLLNYLVVGYHYPDNPNKFLRQTSLFVQARNILSSTGSKNYYGYYAYAGAGLNFTF